MSSSYVMCNRTRTVDFPKTGEQTTFGFHKIVHNVNFIVSLGEPMCGL